MLATVDHGVGSATIQEVPQKISDVALTEDPPPPHPDDNSGCDEDDDFEFAFTLQDQATAPSITADEIFDNGKIRPLYYYPVFDRRLLFEPPPAAAEEEKEPSTAAVRGQLRQLMIEDPVTSSTPALSSSSEVDELEGIPPETYCVWVPKPAAASSARCKKSGSTGSSSLRWRLRGLVVGRSHSDGKEKFVFLETDDKRPPENSNAMPPPAVGKESKGKAVKVSELDVVAAHRLYYVNGGKSGGRRRSFLPYKQELVGFFARTHRA